MLQIKVLKFISFRRKSDSCSDLFLKYGFLSVYELHIYELLKFVLKSICNFHSENYCNEMFQFSKKKEEYEAIRAKITQYTLLQEKTWEIFDQISCC